MTVFDFHIGPEIPLCFFILFVFTLRMKVRPRAFLRINVSPAKMWALLAPYDGKVDHWHNTKVTTRLVPSETVIYAVNYEVTQSNGAVRKFNAQFRLVEREENRLMVLKREGLGAKSTNNELLEIRHELIPETDATRLITTYQWGRRPFLAQLMARADLWGGIYRIKALAETGQSNDRAYWMINLSIALFSAVLSLGAFYLFVGWVVSAIFILALLVHELGHLLAFRMIGQPWGRIVFLPFLGAVAMPRLPYESQSQSVFAALMGPGFSLLLAAACFVPAHHNGVIGSIFALIGILTCILNAFNMLPAEPLDGGVALRSIMTRLLGAKAWSGLVAVGIIVVASGIALGNIGLFVFGVLAVLANLWRRKIDIGLIPLTSLQLCIGIFSYVAITGAHLTMMNWFYAQLLL